MNGPSCMYTLRPLTKLCEEIDLPKCMYSMKNLQANVIINKTAAPVARLLGTSAENRLNVLEQKKLPGMKDLEVRQEVILEQLAQLKQQVTLLKASLKQPASNSSTEQQVHRNTCQNQSVSKKALFQHDVVINASPKHPPYFLLALRYLWEGSLQLQVSWHTHSNIMQAPKDSKNFMPTNWAKTDDSVPVLKISVVWKNVGTDTELMVTPMSCAAIRGDVNILRYLSRLGPQHLNYDDISNPSLTTEIDAILDICHCLAWSSAVGEKQAIVKSLNAKLRKTPFLMGDTVTVADIAAWSMLKQLSDVSNLTANMSKWLQRCSDTFKIEE